MTNTSVLSFSPLIHAKQSPCLNTPWLSGPETLNKILLALLFFRHLVIETIHIKSYFANTVNTTGKTTITCIEAP
jgi:hypothetical protein